ncbi:MAG TPA: hypothetical protein VGY57_05050, partial [Vicinamibacterales bacterium]|nr:hypothetical protein [Vicinamibacterales bacterium]
MTITGCRAAVAPPASQGADTVLVREAVSVTARVAPGATLASILRAQGVAAADASDLVSKATPVFDVRKLRTAQPYRLETSLDGALRWF